MATEAEIKAAMRDVWERAKDEDCIMPLMSAQQYRALEHIVRPSATMLKEAGERASKVATPIIGRSDDNTIRHPEYRYISPETVAALDAHIAHNGPSGMRTYD